MLLILCMVLTMLPTAALAAEPPISLYLDENPFPMTDATPEIRNDRTMIPLRALAERLGADVEWKGETSQIVLTRAGSTVIMIVGETAALVNGKVVQMDVAPYINSGGRTLIPARYVAEFFGQKVNWNQEHQRVEVMEDKSLVGDSNLEAWALPMGAILVRLAQATPQRFGLARGKDTYSTSQGRIPTSQSVRKLLAESWSINNRQELIQTVFSMTDSGHNESFLADVEYIKGLTPEQYNQYLGDTGVDAFMFPYTKQLGEKWGGRGILCWDLFRMSNLVQWGYVAGYITYAEALALLEPAVILLKENFTTWDEAYENYLDGYHWWSRSNVLGKNVWESERGKLYQNAKGSKESGHIFDDTLFTRPIISVPGLTANALVKQTLGN